jgi:MSHA biogenesis protein MshN
MRAEESYRAALNAYSQGRTTESLAQARQALVDDPAHLGARQLLLRQLVEQRATDQARNVAREGLQVHPEQVGWASVLARLEMEKGDLAAARQVIDQTLPRAGNSADFHSLAAAVAQRQGKPGEAAEFYRGALRLKPAEGRNWIGLGIALEAEGHVPEAREAFRRALQQGEGLSPDLQALAERKLRQ